MVECAGGGLNSVKPLVDSCDPAAGSDSAGGLTNAPAPISGGSELWDGLLLECAGAGCEDEPLCPPKPPKWPPPPPMCPPPPCCASASCGARTSAAMAAEKRTNSNGRGSRVECFMFDPLSRTEGTSAILHDLTRKRGFQLQSSSFALHAPCERYILAR
jgi:hypothetical protein